MSFSRLVHLVGKAFRFSVMRPIQRFNIYNRSKKYLEPDSSSFKPAPRAIGSLIHEGPKQYPHLQDASTYKSVRQKRIEALEKLKALEGPKDPALVEANKDLLDNSKNYSEIKAEDSLVIEGSNQIVVNKTVELIETKQQIEQLKIGQADDDSSKKKRNLPKLTNLQLADAASIWMVDKTPPGRLNLNMLQELMINRLADEKHWTPKVVAEKYQIKEEYAENLLKYFKQIRVIISPRIQKILEYTRKDDEVYQATKNTIYIVDKNLRTDKDKMFDAMYLPEDQLEEEVERVIDVPKFPEVIEAEGVKKLEAQRPQMTYRPQPLRIEPYVAKPKNFASVMPRPQRLVKPIVLKRPQIENKKLASSTRDKGT